MGKLTQSYVHGASDLPLIGDTIGVHLDRMAALSPDRPALIARQQEIRWSYGEFRDRVEELAAGLIGLGLMPGDRLGIWSPNNAEWVLTQFASAKAGLILVNINPAYRLHELDYVAEQGRLPRADPGVILQDQRLHRHDPRPLPRARPGQARPAGKPQGPVAPLGHPPGQRQDGGHAEFRRDRRGGDIRRAAGAWPSSQSELQFDDPINIQFTSGTTGNPKGATLTHHNILNNGFFIGEAMRLTEQDRLCIPVPFYHCFGMVLGNLACLTHRACMVVPGEGFDPLAVLETVAAERCTGLHGVPTMFIAILDHPRFAEFDLSSLRTGIMAGSPCPIEVMKRCTEKMHMREITIAYGMTETSPVSFQSSIDDPIERRVSTVGRIQPHLEVKIVDGCGPHRAAGHAGRALDPRLFRDARLLGRGGAQPRGHRRGPLDAYRRSGGGG